MPGDVTTSETTIIQQEASSSLTINEDHRIDWQSMVQAHFPYRYNLHLQLTQEQWKAEYQEETDMACLLLRCKLETSLKLFSVEAIHSEVILTESEQAELFQGLMKIHQNEPPNLEILLHYRLPDNLARALYDYALLQDTGMPTLYWALICRQPITEEMAATVNEPPHRLPLHLAAAFNNPNLIDILLKLGADINKTGFFQETALHRAVFCGNFNTVKHLVEKNEPAINQANKQGNTPLQLAAENNQIEMIKILMAHGARGGLQVLEGAVKAKKSELISTLFVSGLYVPSEIPDWLKNELSQRGEQNNVLRNQNLLGRALTTLEEALADNDERLHPDHIAWIVSQSSPMPLGYTSKGRCFIQDAVKGEPQAIAYLESCIKKSPLSFATWFRDAEKDQNIFRLALNLVTVRYQLIELNEEDRQALYAGSINDLAPLCHKFPYEELRQWTEALIGAPEMVNYRESCLRLAHLVDEKKPVESEQCQNRTEENRARSPQFFQPAHPRDSIASRSYEEADNNLSPTSE